MKLFNVLILFIFISTSAYAAQKNAQTKDFRGGIVTYNADYRSVAAARQVAVAQARADQSQNGQSDPSDSKHENEHTAVSSNAYVAQGEIQESGTGDVFELPACTIL